MKEVPPPPILTKLNLNEGHEDIKCVLHSKSNISPNDDIRKPQNKIMAAILKKVLDSALNKW